MVDEEVKNLQREIQKRTDSNKKTLRALLEARTQEGRITELVQGMKAIASKLGDYDTDFSDLANSITDADADKIRTGEHIKALDTVLAGDKELNQEVFDKIVDLMQAGKLEEAAALAQNDSGVTTDDFEAAVEAKVTAVLASKFKINTDEAVATPKAGFDLAAWRKLSPDKRLEQYDDLVTSLSA